MGPDPGKYLLAVKANGVTLTVPITVSNGG
jgi:hypothetical protein